MSAVTTELLSFGWGAFQIGLVIPGGKQTLEASQHAGAGETWYKRMIKCVWTIPLHMRCLCVPVSDAVGELMWVWSCEDASLLASGCVPTCNKFTLFY